MVLKKENVMVRNVTIIRTETRTTTETKGTATPTSEMLPRRASMRPEAAL